MNLIALSIAMAATLAAVLLALWALRRQERANRELASSRQRYVMLAECSNDGTWEFDVVRRRFEFSRRLYDLFGYAEGELTTPEDLARIMPPEDYAAADAELQAHLAARRSDELQRTLRMRTHDGRVLTILARSVTQYDGDGAPLRVVGSFTDITQRLRDERQLQLAASVFEAGSDGIVISDGRGRVVSANNAFLGMLGHARDEVVGRQLDELQVVGEDARTRAATLHASGAWNGELAWRRADGEAKLLDSSAVAVRDDAGNTTFVIHVCIDTAELKYAQARVHHLAYFDSLTGLPNRSLLGTHFDRLLIAARSAGRPLAVVFMDLDNFKEINDTTGHSVGDEVICAVAQRLGEGLCGEDLLCRFGGDEFVLLLPDTDAPHAEERVRALMQRICKPVEIEGRMLDVAASAGFSMFPDDAGDAENLVRQADTALYCAKEEGGNTVLRFQVWMGEVLSWRHDMLAALREAIAGSQFVLRYQPVVDTAAGKLAGVEALLYWNRPGVGVVAPNAFIALAEETRLIEPIGAWVVREACRQAAAWKAAGLPPFYVSVNVSGLQLRPSVHFQEDLGEAMREHGIDHRDLVLEITERQLVQDIKGGAPSVKRLTSAGMRVSIDDFGTGYSNLESLRNLTVSQIKIDRTFVRNLKTEVGDRAIVQSIIALGRGLGVQVVAEGVENVEQAQWLREFGCHLVQGYLYARPMPAAEVPAFVATLATRAAERAHAAG